MFLGWGKEHVTVQKYDATSPTATFESVLLTFIIYYKERLYIAVFEIPNEFVQPRLENDEYK